MAKQNENNYGIIREYLDRYFLENHHSPCTREIEAGTGIPRATVQRYLRIMSENGEIEYGGRRGIKTELSSKMSDTVSVTQLDTSVICGKPTEPYEAIAEIVTLPKSWTGEGEFFIVTATGDSMKDIGVDEGDMLVVRRQNTAKDGDLAIVLVNGSETTFKRVYHKAGGGYVLHAENGAYSDEKLNRHVERAEIQGIVIKAIKELK